MERSCVMEKRMRRLEWQVRITLLVLVAALSTGVAKSTTFDSVVAETVIVKRKILMRNEKTGVTTTISAGHIRMEKGDELQVLIQAEGTTGKEGLVMVRTEDGQYAYLERQP